MQCKNCGALLNDEIKVCTMCGTPVEEVKETADIVEDTKEATSNEVVEEPVAPQFYKLLYNVSSTGKRVKKSEAPDPGEKSRARAWKEEKSKQQAQKQH